jgi:hypothetical protein
MKEEQHDWLETLTWSNKHEELEIFRQFFPACKLET